jgi:hypothetical protein
VGLILSGTVARSPSGKAKVCKTLRNMPHLMVFNGLEGH